MGRKHDLFPSKKVCRFTNEPGRLDWLASDFLKRRFSGFQRKVDVGFRMRRRQEPSLELRRGEVNPAVQHGAEEGSERFAVGVLRLRIVRDRMVTEMR